MSRHTSPSKNTHTTPQGTASRKTAVALLMQILKAQKTLEEAQAAVPAWADLSPQDKAFCHHLTLTVLRHKGTLDGLLRHFMQKPLKASRLDIKCCLYIGAAQILWMQVPAHAAVDTSVRLAKKHQAAMAGLVNAVLKKIAAEGNAWLQPQDMAQLNTPEWLWQSWVAAYGEESTRAIAQAHQQEPALDMTVKDATKTAHWAVELKAELLPTGSLRKNGSRKNMAEWAGFESGDWWVQELAASLPVKLLGNVTGKHVLDCCAAPGGKTAQLAAAGATVVAVDQSAKRLTRLSENLERLQLQEQVKVVTANLLEWNPQEKFDVILLDAPCSATGTIRRHPELPWLRTAEDVTRLVEIQQKLLHAAHQWLKPEGVLLYAVCSLQPEEGEAQLTFAQETLGLKIEPVIATEVAGRTEWITPEGALRCLPSHLPDQGHIDGFFAMKLKR